METLLRQKVCKSKHNFLITKQLEEKKDERKKEKRLFFSEAKGLGFIGLCHSCFSLYSVPLQSGLDCIRIAFLATKKPDKFTTYQVLFL